MAEPKETHDRVTLVATVFSCPTRYMKALRTVVAMLVKFENRTLYRSWAHVFTTLPQSVPSAAIQYAIVERAARTKAVLTWPSDINRLQ